MIKTMLNSKFSLLLLGLIVTSTNAIADYSKSYEGYQLFQTYCYICHGSKAKGDGPLANKLDTRPSDLTNDANLSKKSDRDLYRTIEGTAPHGQISKSMPGWRAAISASQINGLVAYIRFLHRGKHSIIGDPDVGKTIYDRSCVVCHGNDGEGDGALTKVFSLEPANHIDAKRMDSISNVQMIDVISNGGAGKSMMPGWAGTLSKEEIDGLVSYIRLLSAH